MFNFFHKTKQPIKLWFTTDIHCHVIPGVDDGSPNVDTSVELIEALGELGIKRIIATPHVTQATFENSPETIKVPLTTLKEKLVDANIDIPITNAAEYRIDDLFDQCRASGLLMTYPDNYILIENSFIQEPWNLEQIIFDLQVKGYKPIFAHPERYLYYHNRVNRYKELHDSGLLFQINLLSLAGYHGKAERKMAEYFIDNNMVDFIGTDTHGHRHIDAFRNYLISRDAERDMSRLAPMIKNDIFN